MNINKLELTWIGKEKKPKLEPRVLIEDFEKSYYAEQRVSEKDIYDNMLIFGDNLLALKALETEYTGKVKCIYLDPPFNTGHAFSQYDDNIEHSIWLTLMYNRLLILSKLLSIEGTLWVELDECEHAYCKVMLDEIMGRDNYLATIVYRRRMSQANLSSSISVIHNYILVYAKDIRNSKLNRIITNTSGIGEYKNPDNDPRGNYASAPCSNKGGAIYSIATPSGIMYTDEWRFKEETYLELLKDNRIYFPNNGKGKPRYKIFESERIGVIPSSWWDEKEFATQNANKESKDLFGIVDKFDTPKPEALLERIISIASNPGDIVLDSFAGSGTTGAVAHKMRRKWIMVELGEHCHTHIIPRMKKVIDGTDQGGISKDVNWKGGGGFRYYRLAPSLLEKDKWGNWVISKDYNKELLAEAICKLEGFIYAPSETIFWQQGYSTESDYIYVTTQILNEEQIRLISEEVGENRTLLILCLAFTADVSKFNNLTVKKIPKQILNKCEYGKDDYSLNIRNLPLMEQPEKQSNIFEEGEI